MDSPRKPDDEGPQDGDPPDRGQGEATEDRAAILSRRAFLIESALASAGITVGVAGCGPSKKDTAPQVCLSVPRECLKVAQPRDAGPPPPRPNVCLQPQVCLSVPAPRPTECLTIRPRVCLRVAPQKCLKIAPPRERPDGGVPRPCLSRPRPRVCLSIAPPTKTPSGKICLDF
jgi:hypothetical protein